MSVNNAQVHNVRDEQPNNDRLVILIEVGDKNLNQKTLAIAARWKVDEISGA